MKHFCLILLFASPVWADALSIGIRGGIPFGDAFDAVRGRNFSLAGHNRFVLGPTLELRLPAGFGLNIDALYRRYNFETTTDAGAETKGAGQWEFPIMVRYHFPGIIARPFVGAGPVFQKITGITSTRNSTGLALGAGVDVKVPFVRLTPELRYSRRFQQPIVTLPLSGLTANSNQVDFMIGITF
ncbi:MAG: PorT family protein [Bryobacterales bacterium]|nr:PorT family protein [Bryobacterales bacterium]